MIFRDRKVVRRSLITLLLSCPLGLLGQAADVSAPAGRAKLLAEAKEFIASRSEPAAIPIPAPNPFVWPEEPEEVDETVSATSIEVPRSVVMNAELLAKLAERIPASGTVILGGQPILLLGQKRLKVGDEITLSFEGENYDLTIEGITATSFTVRRGALIYTRPTYLPSSTAPTSRQ